MSDIKTVVRFWVGIYAAAATTAILVLMCMTDCRTVEVHDMAVDEIRAIVTGFAQGTYTQTQADRDLADLHRRIDLIEQGARLLDERTGDAVRRSQEALEYKRAPDDKEPP